MVDRVKNKKAVVTGAAQGLGAAIARKLLEEGASVAITDLNAAGVAETAEALNRDFPGRAFAFAHDVRDEAQWINVLKEANAALGGINILVNNAGIGANGSVEDLDFATWKRVLDVDLDSVFLGCKHVMAYMRATGVEGSIVNISSIAGLIASHAYAAYNAAKAGVWLLSKSVALHGARMQPQIRSNSVHPTFIKTPILDPLAAMLGREEAYAKLARQVPLGRLGEPEEVAYLVLYLASDESRFVTGAEFKIDGGISAL